MSQFSDGIFQFAVTGFVFFSPESHTTALAVAAGLAVLLLPYSVLGPFVWVFIDRWSRRQILVVAPIVRALLLFAAARLPFAQCRWTATLETCVTWCLSRSAASMTCAERGVRVESIDGCRRAGRG